MKRANQSGSVYKLSGKRRNPWVAVITHGYDKSGNQKRRYIGYYASKTEALKALARYDIILPRDQASRFQIYTLSGLRANIMILVYLAGRLRNCLQKALSYSQP